MLSLHQTIKNNILTLLKIEKNLQEKELIIRLIHQIEHLKEVKKAFRLNNKI
jgi:hypothetical protein